MELELRGKRVIALGERDGVPGQAIADCMRSAGAEVVLATSDVVPVAGEPDLDELLLGMAKFTL